MNPKRAEKPNREDRQEPVFFAALAFFAVHYFSA